MLILLPSDVQGRGNALIISSRMPLKEKPTDGFWKGGGAGWGAAEGGWLRWGETAQYGIRIGPRWYRMCVLNSIELN